jgi:hypothetical protein
MLAVTAMTLYVITLGSCLNDPLEPVDSTKAQLEVYVYGTLSLEPRNNIAVTIHHTEADAEDGINEVKDRRYTDKDGLVMFRNLEPNTTYWVRAKPVVGHSKEETDVLIVGYNHHSIDIL